MQQRKAFVLLGALLLPGVARAEVERCADLAACEKQCAAKVSRSCVALAEIFANGEGVKVDRARAFTHWRQACEGGERDACWELATQHQPQPEEAAVRVTRARCEAGDGEDCVAIGYREKDPAATTMWIKKAMPLLARACDADRASACLALSSLFGSGWFGVEKSEARKEEFTRRAANLFDARCEKGSMRDCVLAANAQPPGPKEWARKLQLLDRACAASYANACLKLAEIFIGPYGTRDKHRAAALFDRACKADDAFACSRLATFLSQEANGPLDRVALEEALRRACERHESFYCDDYAQQLLSGKALQKNPARAAAVYERACDVQGTSCRHFALLLLAGRGVPADAKRAGAVLARGCPGTKEESTCEVAGWVKDCDAGKGDACDALAETWSTHLHDEELAARLYEKSCDAGSGWGCLRLADRHPGGRDVKRLLLRACSLGEGKGCETASEQAKGAEKTKLHKRACELQPEICGERKGPRFF